MADQQTELAIVIEAVNNASTQLKQVEKDLGSLTNTVKNQGKESTTASLGFGKLVAGVATGNIVATLATKAVQGLNDAVRGMTDIIKDSIRVASQYELALIGLSRISQKFGEDQSMATETAKELASDGLISLSTAAEGLQKLMQGGLSLDKATELMKNYKDEAAFGRSSTIKYDQAVKNLSESFYTENSMIGNLSGQTENWNILIARGAELMNKSVNELSKSERAQAKYLAQQELSLLTQGDAIKYAETYSGSLSKLENSYKELKNVIGNVFMPVLSNAYGEVGKFIVKIVDFAKENEGKLRAIGKQFADTISEVINDFKNFIERNSENIYIAVNFIIKIFQRLSASLKSIVNVIQIVVNGFETLANGLVTAGKIIYDALTGDWEGVAKAEEDWLERTDEIGTAFKGNLEDMMNAGSQYRDAYSFDLKKWWDNIEEIEKSSQEKLLQINREGGDKLSQEQKDTLEKMQHNLEKANRDYQQAVEKRQKDFEQSFEDLIISHRDTITELTADLKKENESYQKNLVNLLDDYDDAMEHIEKRHKEKTASVLEDMADERKETLEEIEEITEAYNEERSLLEQEGADRLTNLQIQLDRELALGDNANQAKIDALKQMIAYEQEGLADSLADKEDNYDEEVADLNDALDEKLNELEESLTAENTAYEEAFADRKSQYEDDVAEAKAAYLEKRESLEAELSKEVEIRERYAEDFKRIGDKTAEDDITRLVNKFNTEKAELEREHQEKLADIKYQAFKGGEEFGSNFASGIESSKPLIDNQLNQIEADIDRVMNKSSSFVFGGGSSAGGGGASGSWGGGGGGGGGGGAFARGGLATQPGIVGEAGPEVVLPLNFPKRMAQIMQSMGLSGEGGQVTQNFYVTVNNKQDVDVLMERAGFAMQQGGFA